MATLLLVWHSGAQGLAQLGQFAAFPPVLLGAGLLLMGVGLLLRARLAWAMTLILSLLVGGLALWTTRHLDTVFFLAALLIVVLMVWARRFNRSSVATSSLFALLGVGSLLIYALFGSLWFGEGFAPPIRTLTQALYFSVVTMSTVGYGDVVPKTDPARLFTVSLIVLGITVFATTLSVVVGPLIGGSLKRTLEKRMHHASRRHHVVIVGASALAQALQQSLKARAVPTTVILPEGMASPYPEDIDMVVGDPSRSQTLQQAGVPQARAVLVLRDDDADNAFIVLAVKELAPSVRTVAAVQDARNVAKIRRVQPDMMFAPQLLGGELLARSLLGEPIDNALINDLLQGKSEEC
ncbi:TrkA-N domain/Ion channel [Thiomonas bhubaneswarensis]|uniref:TrkA-N domain/Ion channel n=2 Tax=Thiomonas bhubaneswarensis TaxID=339866 RepID=A0A0K6HQM9_9BURK|nr:TrkA-N domain/Ion channel [Thiomonas bhubaneswarensis]